MDYERNQIYDDIDMRNAFSVGFWTGSITGSLSMLILCLLVGYYAV